MSNEFIMKSNLAESSRTKEKIEDTFVKQDFASWNQEDTQMIYQEKITFKGNHQYFVTHSSIIKVLNIQYLKSTTSDHIQPPYSSAGEQQFLLQNVMFLFGKSLTNNIKFLRNYCNCNCYLFLM